VSEWITQREAAEILGCHKSRVAKLVSAGRLKSRGGRTASLDRAQVVALAAWRAGASARAQQERARRVAVREAARTHHRPPDDEHDWLSIRQTAELLGVSRVAVHQRCRRDRLPCVAHGKQIWIRRDLLELVEHARAAEWAERLTRQAQLG